MYCTLQRIQTEAWKARLYVQLVSQAGRKGVDLHVNPNARASYWTRGHFCEKRLRGAASYFLSLCLHTLTLTYSHTHGHTHTHTELGREGDLRNLAWLTRLIREIKQCRAQYSVWLTQGRCKSGEHGSP